MMPCSDVHVSDDDHDTMLLLLQLTVVNFVATNDGLSEHMLSTVVSLEVPELEQQSEQLRREVADNFKQVMEIEDRVLELLTTVEGKLLDDDNLVITLMVSGSYGCLSPPLFTLTIER